MMLMTMVVMIIWPGDEKTMYTHDQTNFVSDTFAQKRVG